MCEQINSLSRLVPECKNIPISENCVLSFWFCSLLFFLVVLSFWLCAVPAVEGVLSDGLGAVPSVEGVLSDGLGQSLQ